MKVHILVQARHFRIIILRSTEIQSENQILVNNEMFVLFSKKNCSIFYRDDEIIIKIRIDWYLCKSPASWKKKIQWRNENQYLPANTMVFFSNRNTVDMKVVYSMQIFILRVNTKYIYYSF